MTNLCQAHIRRFWRSRWKAWDSDCVLLISIPPGCTAKICRRRYPNASWGSSGSLSMYIVRSEDIYICRRALQPVVRVVKPKSVVFDEKKRRWVKFPILALVQKATGYEILHFKSGCHQRNWKRRFVNWIWSWIASLPPILAISQELPPVNFEGVTSVREAFFRVFVSLFSR